MTKTFVADNAFVEAGRCDADGFYWCVRADDGVYADGYAATEEEATKKCRASHEEWLGKQ